VEGKMRKMVTKPPIYFSDYGSQFIYTDKDMVNNCLSESDGFALGLRSIK
ncbi:19653_t:CDS:1, partial [Funneliformis geosporum]